MPLSIKRKTPTRRSWAAYQLWFNSLPSFCLKSWSYDVLPIPMSCVYLEIHPCGLTEGREFLYQLRVQGGITEQDKRTTLNLIRSQASVLRNLNAAGVLGVQTWAFQHRAVSFDPHSCASFYYIWIEDAIAQLTFHNNFNIQSISNLYSVEIHVSQYPYSYCLEIWN